VRYLTSRDHIDVWNADFDQGAKWIGDLSPFLESYTAYLVSIVSTSLMLVLLE